MEQARQNLESQVLERAAKDPQFREQLRQDPRGTVSRDFGVQVPPDITVQVLEETPSTGYLVLPPTPAQRGQALSDEELEAVAGGWTAPTEFPCGEGCTQYCSNANNACCGGRGDGLLDQTRAPRTRAKEDIALPRPCTGEGYLEPRREAAWGCATEGAATTEGGGEASRHRRLAEVVQSPADAGIVGADGARVLRRRTDGLEGARRRRRLPPRVVSPTGQVIESYRLVTDPVTMVGASTTTS